MALPPVGVQLIVLGDKYDMETQCETVLDTLKAAGYDAVEGGPRDAVAYKRMLDERGLRHAGSHAGLHALQNDLPAIVEYLRVTGAIDVCNSGFLNWGDLALEDYREGITILNEAGRRLRDEGIHLHYHNHDFEFKKIDGDKTGMDILLDGLNPQFVDLCVDVAWVQKGGEEPVEYLRQHRDRIGYLHFKDFNDEGWIELGQGKVDFTPLVELLPTMPRVRWVVLEQDNTRIDPLESMTISRRNLRKKFGY